jgi:hypothetical protein
VALIIVAVVGFGGGTPSESASAAKVESFYGGGPARQYIAAFLLAAAAPFVLAFAVSVASRHADRSAWALLLVCGGTLFAASILGTAFVHFALTEAGDKGISGDALRVLNILDADTWTLFNPSLGVMMLGAAATLLARPSAPRWLAWAALVLGVALFIPLADFFALLLSGIWIVAESVMLYRRAPAAESAPVGVTS